jgi:hypothetical protein
MATRGCTSSTASSEPHVFRVLYLVIMGSLSRRSQGSLGPVSVLGCLR